MSRLINTLAIRWHNLITLFCTFTHLAVRFISEEDAVYNFKKNIICLPSDGRSSLVSGQGDGMFVSRAAALLSVSQSGINVVGALQSGYWTGSSHALGSLKCTLQIYKNIFLNIWHTTATNYPRRNTGWGSIKFFHTKLETHFFMELTLGRRAQACWKRKGPVEGMIGTHVNDWQDMK